MYKVQIDHNVLEEILDRIFKKCAYFVNYNMYFQKV